MRLGLEQKEAGLERVERELCQVASVLIDAGFPEEELLSGLEARGTPYVARVKNNAVLNRMAEPYLKRPVGRPPAEPRALRPCHVTFRPVVGSCLGPAPRPGWADTPMRTVPVPF